MTDYGLRIRNDNLDFQIDSLYVNYSLYEHGESVSMTSNSETTVTFSTATAYPPLIALKPDSSGSGYCGITRYTKSGSNYTGFGLRGEYSLMPSIDWQAFIPSETKSSETYGLRVYNSSSELVYDSGHETLIITDVDTVTPAYNATSTITHPSDSNAYFIMSPHGFMRYSPGGAPSYFLVYWGMFENVSSTQVSFGGVAGFYSGSVPSHPPGTDGFWPSSWTIMTVKKAF